MKYYTKLYRNKQNLSLTDKVNYRHVWGDRMPDIKIYLLTMSLKQVAAIYNATVSQLSNAMSAHGVFARVERHRNKLKLINQ